MAVKAVVFDAYGTLFDTQSIAATVNATFPDHAEYITQLWRLKQLEYSWLRTLMGCYEDFQAVTRQSLVYALDTLGRTAEPALLDRIVHAYDSLTPYPEAAAVLDQLAQYQRAILSNGTASMLQALVRNAGMDRRLEAIISVEAKRAYKPDRRAYELVQEHLGVPPEDVVFVSSNGFDIAGARSFGFKVVRIERVPAAALQQELADAASIGPGAMFRAQRTQLEALGFLPDKVIHSLTALPALIEAWSHKPSQR